MGIVDTLRRAEEQARKAARLGAERTIVGLDDAERAIRGRMRIYPKQMPIPVRAGVPSAASTTTVSSEPFISDQPLNPPKAS